MKKVKYLLSKSLIVLKLSIKFNIHDDFMAFFHHLHYFGFVVVH